MKLISSWTLLSSGKNELFSQRWGHTANLIGNSVYVYGGFANKYLKSMYKIDLSSFPPCQEKIEPKKLPPKLQLKRSLHSSISYGQKIIYYGGMNDYLQSQTEINKIDYEPYSFDTQTLEWNIIKTQNTPQKLRTYHTANLVCDKYMLIYGGENCLQPNDEAMYPFLLDLSQSVWKQVILLDNKKEKDRTNNVYMRKFHCASVINKKIVYIYGGYRIDYEGLNEMLILYFDDFALSSSGKEVYIRYKSIVFQSYNDCGISSPFPRWGASLTSHDNNSLILFGGRNKYDLNDMWIYNTKLNTWKQIDSYNEPPSPRRKHVAFLYNNIYFVLGGYRGEYFNDIYYMNLNLLFSLCEKDDTLISYINNEKNFDLIIKSKSCPIYCHKSFFLSRIVINDFLFSSFLLSLSKKENNKIIDISSLEVKKESILAFITLLYLGYFPSYITKITLYEIIQIMQHLSLIGTARKLFYSLVMSSPLYKYKNYKNCHHSMLEIIQRIFPYDSYPINVLYYNRDNLILELNQLHLYKKLPLLLDNSPYFRYPNKKKLLPKAICEIFSNYITRGLLPVIEENDIKGINLLIEVLYYADYFCYNDLYNCIELRLINIMRNNNTYSKRFLFCLLCFSFLSNSGIFFQYILEKICGDFTMNASSICEFLKKILVNDNNYNEIIESIKINFDSNKDYYLLTHKNAFLHNDNAKYKVVDFSKMFNNHTFKEKKEVNRLLSSLSNSKINFNIPIFSCKINKKQNL